MSHALMVASGVVGLCLAGLFVVTCVSVLRLSAYVRSGGRVHRIPRRGRQMYADDGTLIRG
ncbi:MAG: hypothetical protein WCA46_22325 [Actinocatenispora sp.]